MDIRRGEVYLAELSGCVGCEVKGAVPVVVLQNDVGNRFSPTVIVAVIKSAQTVKKPMPTHVYVKVNKDNRFFDSVVLTEAVRTIDKRRLKFKIATLEIDEMEEIDRTLSYSLNLDDLIKTRNENLNRGDIYFADLSGGVGSEQTGMRPVLVVQNNIGNKFSPCTIVLSITSQIQKAKLPTHTELRASLHGLELDSVALSEQIRTVDKSRLKYYITSIDELTMKKINDSLNISFGLHNIGAIPARRELVKA